MNFQMKGDHIRVHFDPMKNDNISDLMKGIYKYGSFGEAPPEITGVTGKKNYDVEMTLWDGDLVIHASLSDVSGCICFCLLQNTNPISPDLCR